MKTKSALSYFGSDSEVAEQLAGFLDDCKHVTIPFVGGGSILPYLRARAIVANDLNELAINFYRVMSDRCGAGSRDELIRRCQTTLSHPSEMQSALMLLAEPSLEASFIELAWAYWAVCWIGRKGKGGTKSVGGMPSIRRTANGGTNASRIRAAADDLQAWAKHFERCEWESIDFRKLIPKVSDSVGCGIYCDPPWRGLGNGYLHSFSDQDHYDLEKMLGWFSDTKIVVRYGDDEYIRKLYSNHRWTIIGAESRTQTNVVKGELWIVNNADIPNAGGKPSE